MKGEAMYFSDSWSFVVETEKGTLIPVDLSEEDDWGDIEPVRRINEFGNPDKPTCTIGKIDRDGDENLEITRVWEYKEDEPFNGKFSTFRLVTLVDFVRRLLDAGVAFHGQEEEDAAKLKEHYGV